MSLFYIFGTINSLCELNLTFEAVYDMFISFCFFFQYSKLHLNK